MGPLRKISSKWVVFIGAALLGSANGAWFLYGEFQNNNQGEYFDPLTGMVDYPYAAITFAVAGMPIFLLASVLGGVVLLLIRAVARTTMLRP